MSFAKKAEDVMFDFLYEWIRNLAFYMVLVTAALHVIPNHTYKKYIRFFTGMVLILLLLTPALKLFHREDFFQTLFQKESYRQEREYFQKMTEDLERSISGEGIKEEDNGGIEVGEIQIGTKD